MWIVLPVTVALTVVIMDMMQALFNISLTPQYQIFKNKHNWIMTWLYTMTFGSFIGYSAAFPLLVKIIFGELPDGSVNPNAINPFTECGVKIVDHHTASKQFMQHWKKEATANRMVPADWGMTIPPISPSTTEVFHQPMQNVCLKPNLFFQSAAWHRKNLSSLAQLGRQCPFHNAR